MVRVFENRQSANHLAGAQHLTADRADHVLEAEPLAVGVIPPGARELAETDRHHLDQPALDAAGEVGVPLHPADEHRAIGRVRGLVEEHLDPVIGRAE